MMIFNNAKRNNSFILVLILCCLVATFQGCKKKRSEMSNILFKRTHNPVFKDLDQDEFTAYFKKELKREKSEINNSQLVIDHYARNDYEPDFVLYHLWDGGLQAMLDKYHKAYEHGIDPQLFKPAQISALIDKFYNKDAIKTPEDAYRYIAQLEIMASSTLIDYSSALQYGIISPKKIYSRYFIKTLQPDTASIDRVFSVENMPAYLDSIQPKDLEYLTLQKAYLDGYAAPKMSKEETRRILLVNMERLRWKNKPAGNEYVYVNIPDFHLDVIDSGRSILNMKVCVGEGRNKKYLNSLENYNDTCKADNPYAHETPLLSSVIHSVQVNPVWNIPQSIATKEIIVQAAKDPYYLSNKNINVYKDDKLIRDPETIDWSKVTKYNSDYEFRQQPGEDNSLGKIKFLFQNKSSVYLHDTPAKEAFHYTMRAVSHGCVRLEKPLELAHTLFTDTVKYNLIAKDMQEDDPMSEDISLRPKIPVYITYITCWSDQDGQLQFRGDVYGLDIVLYDHMKKYLPAE
jgi:murein L,D-transpeptidase YcbB/YkuD